jgi:hypothetical protein
LYKKLPANNLFPQLDECRYLIIKIVEQAVRDFISLGNSSAPIERNYYETACEFLFDNEYKIDYGGKERSLQDLLDILDIDVQWFRERVVRLKNRCLLDSKAKRAVIYGLVKRKSTEEEEED